MPMQCNDFNKLAHVYRVLGPPMGEIYILVLKTHGGDFRG